MEKRFEQPLFNSVCSTALFAHKGPTYYRGVWANQRQHIVARRNIVRALFDVLCGQPSPGRGQLIDQRFAVGRAGTGVEVDYLRVDSEAKQAVREPQFLATQIWFEIAHSSHRCDD